MTEKSTSVIRIERPEDAPRVFLDAFNAGDLDGLVNLFEPDAVIVVASGQVVTGSAEIREELANFRSTWKWWEIRLVSHHRVGDIALNTVEHKLQNSAPDGSANTLSVRATVVFRRQTDGSWRFVIDNAAPFE